MQAPRRDAMLDRLLTESERGQLTRGHHAVLASRERPRASTWFATS
jgi:hypothetical protein